MIHVLHAYGILTKIVSVIMNFKREPKPEWYLNMVREKEVFENMVEHSAEVYSGSILMCTSFRSYEPGSKKKGKGKELYLSV